MPITFPPEPFDGTLLSAMSVPDLRGSQGTYSYFSSDPDERMTPRSGERVPLAWADGVARGVITGPADDRREGAASSGCRSRCAPPRTGRSSSGSRARCIS